eukprot:scaffold295570_cov24-Tisochrysis_lutea.AAC.1
MGPVESLSVKERKEREEQAREVAMKAAIAEMKVRMGNRQLRLSAAAEQKDALRAHKEHHTNTKLGGCAS